MKYFWLAIIPLLLLTGCAEVPFEVVRFTPILQNSHQKTFSQGKLTFVSDENQDIKVSVGLLEYNAILGVSLSVKNKTNQDILPKEYTISLYDGRDLKPVKILSRNDLVKIKAQYTSGGSGAIQDKVIDATMTNVMNVANVPTKDKIAGIIDQAINNYFAFRPIYKKETRQGILCFVTDFNLEYPLTFFITKDDESLTFRFKLPPPPPASKK